MYLYITLLKEREGGRERIVNWCVCDFDHVQHIDDQSMISMFVW